MSTGAVLRCVVLVVGVALHVPGVGAHALQALPTGTVIDTVAVADDQRAALAAYASVAGVMLNLDEAITKE